MAGLGGSQHFTAAVAGQSKREPDIKVFVGEKPGKAIVLLDQDPFSSQEVNPINVVKLGVAAVKPNEQFFRDPGAGLLYECLHPLNRGQVSDVS
jgi:hypothetical protein